MAVARLLMKVKAKAPARAETGQARAEVKGAPR
jgi:hypothetical protein